MHKDIRKILIIFIIIVLQFTFIGCAASQKVAYDRSKSRSVSLFTIPDSATVYFDGNKVGITPTTYQFQFMYERYRHVNMENPEFVFSKQGFVPTRYQFVHPTKKEAILGLFKHSKNHFMIYKGHYKDWDTMYQIPVNVQVDLQTWAEGGGEFEKLINELVSKGNCREAALRICEIEPCPEAIDFIKRIKGYDILVPYLKDENVDFRMAVAVGLDKTKWVPADSLEFSYYLFAQQNWDDLMNLGGVAAEPLLRGIYDSNDKISRTSFEAFKKILLKIIHNNDQIDPLILSALIKRFRDITFANNLRRSLTIDVIDSKIIESLKEPERSLMHDPAINILSYICDFDSSSTVSLIKMLETDENETFKGYLALTLAQSESFYNKLPVSALISSFPIITSTIAGESIGGAESGWERNYEKTENMKMGVANLVESAFNENELYGGSAADSIITKFSGFLEFVKVDVRISQATPINTPYEKMDLINYEYIITFQLYTGAYALNKITGENFGTDKARWLKWWDSRRKLHNSKRKSHP